ncbi:MAG: CBS domain-containing protein [Deltaproteobacteria bacterium]|nr:MAG: CBS domain-containing protein [Deltaproteobacteria bacterium]
MIPKQMDQFLHDVLPDSTWRNRLQVQGPLRFIEFRATDVERLHRLGVGVDRLGPRLVVCMWDEEGEIEAGGYLVVDNLAMGRPSMGGVRMLPDITPLTIFNLARGMTLKNAAADLPYGGGKSGIIAPDRNLTPAEHTEIVRRFARLLYRYREVYLPGPDVGTNDADMKTIAIENGLDCAVSKPVEMGGNRIDQLGAAAGGVVIAIATLLSEMPRLKALPQFANLTVPDPADLTVLIQGFGAVGANTARMLAAWPAPPRIIGISDAGGYLYDEQGLPIADLLEMGAATGQVTYPFFAQRLAERWGSSTKFATAAADLLRESAFCLVPAAPIAHYLGADPGTHPSMTVDRAGRWAMIVEGANTYSPDPARRAARMRMERAVYWQRGTVIASDFLVNSGGVIFAAQEQSIQTPSHLCTPDRFRGNREAVEQWLGEHRDEFNRLAARRLQAGISQRDAVIRRNMKELVDSLVADPDLLPIEAAEQISIRRIASSEAFRCVADIMEPLQAISPARSVRDAAQILIADPHEMLAVVSVAGVLVGVVTDWDIAKASATACAADVPVAEIMSREIITARPDDNVIDALRKLETHEISAMPVVDDGAVLGVVSTDILAHKTLYRLLQAQA